VLHPLRTMLGSSIEEHIVAVLHDVREDCPGWTFVHRTCDAIHATRARYPQQTDIRMTDPKLIASKHNGMFTRDGVTVQVCIYRHEHTKWTLELVDVKGTSIVWDNEFDR
jgi:hypothetical protein